MQNNIKSIEAVDVYLEKRKTRQYVGRLKRQGSKYVFCYDEVYAYGDRSISLGPDLPLSAKKFTSKKLFPSFEDRIPSKKNPAYKEYCTDVGIDPLEKDPLILVATLGHKGPSSFICIPVTTTKSFQNDDLVIFRKELNLSVREFADLFDFSSATIHRIECKKSSGKDAIKRIEIYYYFPNVALYEVEKNGFKINDSKREKVIKILKDKQKKMP
ncbi:MAG: HipA N-terminal domain-containing protein [Oligoflexia bacterium]|nr:HipA N-terminal domain-containing protein [Oligoflexia bacterium]